MLCPWKAQPHLISISSIGLVLFLHTREKSKAPKFKFLAAFLYILKLWKERHLYNLVLGGSRPSSFHYRNIFRCARGKERDAPSPFPPRLVLSAVDIHGDCSLFSYTVFTSSIPEKLNFPPIKYSCMGYRHCLFENSCHHSEKYLDSHFGKNRDCQKCFGIKFLTF